MRQCDLVMGSSFQAQHAAMQCRDKGEQAARKWEQDQFCIFWSKMLFHVKHTVQVFPSRSIQLHGERKEIAFIPQSSFDLVTPDGTGTSGLLRVAMSKQLGRVALVSPGHGRVWAQRELCEAIAPPDLAEQSPCSWKATCPAPALWAGWVAQRAAKVLLAHGADGAARAMQQL